MATVTLQGPPTQADSLGVAVAHRSFTGAGSTWAAQHSLGGAASDDIEISPPCRAIRCGGAGILHVSCAMKTSAGVDWTDSIPAVLAGETIQGQFDKVFADSTVTNITIMF